MNPVVHSFDQDAPSDHSAAISVADLLSTPQRGAGGVRFFERPSVIMQQKP